ncbi:MAG: hypothetical protein E6J41_31140 [Chloroflexi bacterium]|nr:MAG: hypothetical protein E6J41_31140 [Chloroflexota bacterium]
MNRRQLLILAVLAVVVVLYVVATAAGARQGGGGGDVRSDGLAQRLGSVLVLPAGSGDVVVPAGCGRGGTLTLAAGQRCEYRLRSGFLARRLSVRLTAGSSLTAVLTQPKPEVTDTETLDAGHASVDLVWRQDGSTLTLTCGSDQKSGCAAKAG